MAQGYHDFVAGEVLSAANLEDYCQNQTTMRFASAAARDAALAAVLTEGLRAYLIDLNVETVYSGSTWSTQGPVHGALTSWTPVVTQGATPTLTVTRATYSRTGRRVSGDALVSLTSSGTGATNVAISLPVAAAAGSANSILGEGWIFDTSAGFFYYGILMWASSTTANFLIRTAASGATYLGTTSFTAALATGDLVSIIFNYEANADA